MASIEIRQVSKAYGKQTVLQNVSFNIDNGEFMVLVGPSGCGKSTLLRMISGLEEISDGQMLIDGQVVNDLPARDRDIAMVFQSYALYPHMTVEKNMGFSLRIDGRPKAEIKQKVAAAAEILDLGALLKRKPGQLSGGQRQRVAMGRAIVREPKVFLFDEPLSNLDAQLRVQMRSEINALQARFKTTTVYVTHDQVEAMTMADRIVVLRAGNVEQVGAPLDLFDHPANMFVAQFIGSPRMNLINGRLEKYGASISFVAGEFKLVIPQRFAEHAGEEVALGLRPNDIALVPISHPTARPARLELVEATGTETMVSMRVQGQTIQGVFKERLSAAASDEVHVSFKPEACHVFSLATGESL